MVNYKIPQMEPWFDDNERKAINDYMSEGGWLTEFKKTRIFEDMIANYTGSKHCSVVMNGTVSLYIAMLAAGIGSKDKVLVPDFTMVATANAIRLTGAKITFVDICNKSLCIDLKEIKKHKKIKAIALVSINGRYPYNIEEIVEYCKDRNIFILEDAAQSLGSFFKGRHVGTFGDIASFSFSMPKIITTGQGGALITNDKELYENILMIKDFGRKTSGSDDYITMGFNFKFTDLQAVVGIEQMKKIHDRVNIKRKNYWYLVDLLKDIKNVSFIKTDKETTPWFNDIIVEDRDNLIHHLKNNDIGTRVVYPPLHSLDFYNQKGKFPNTQFFSDNGLWLPSSSKLGNDHIEYIADKIKYFYKA